MKKFLFVAKIVCLHEQTLRYNEEISLRGDESGEGHRRAVVAVRGKCEVKRRWRPSDSSELNSALFAQCAITMFTCLWNFFDW